MRNDLDVSHNSELPNISFLRHIRGRILQSLKEFIFGQSHFVRISKRGGRRGTFDCDFQVIAESKTDGIRLEKAIRGGEPSHSAPEGAEAEGMTTAARRTPTDDDVDAEDRVGLLRCFYQNVLSFIDAYYADIARFLGSSNITAIKASAQQSLQQVAARAEQVTVGSEQQAYRAMFQPFISATGRTPAFLE